MGIGLQRIRLYHWLVAAAAEAEEGGVWVLQFRLAALEPEILPFFFEVVHVVAGGDGAGVVVGFRVEERETAAAAGEGRGFIVLRLVNRTLSPSMVTA